ncbi:hypothetical protein [Cytophaga hutchinsonii]|uniref:Uncharacterized protein n=1 Tax=Cytophaga hutchinsonii (strain ATCC 33406 / DSM 1761 / CIP 103989 / NBRC 15051 / NCIMB 9469 / D465) TaxID=269798 RepID=A0A6N4ST97_CYTH3|nr:hypothetical protein [Cytophaga hutchinsonii]ABG59534.1 conserved hypothetical protein [Cytophaga hutchinsonii ATCC 33406]SFX95013.1 hypothetical protein SAMN04487930_11449 [Cytophaga hutchinsonii ATCC 33406]
MENLPSYICIAFVLTTLLTIFFFYEAAGRSKTTLIVLLAWITLQALISTTGFYTVTDSLPPRFLLLVIPPLLTILVLFNTSQGKDFIDRLDVKVLTLLHVVRIPVEIVLFCLFLYKQVPELMTFEGRNLDILSGISAPFIYYYGYVKQKLSQTVLLAWNIICMGLLLNIVVYAVLSTPVPFQQFAFDQPNVAVLYFPFVWLPCCVVPLVLLSHLVSIRKLLKY